MHSVEGCSGSRMLATDGMLGRVVDLLFDEDKWVIRYLVVGTGDWLGKRRVLISPYSVRFMDTGSKMIVVSLTRNQVAESPETPAPSAMTRKEELRYCTYFGYPAYWPCVTYWPWGAMPTAEGIVGDRALVGQAASCVPAQESSGLHSCSALNGYAVDGEDGSLGRVDDLFFEERSWAIRHIVVVAGSWLASRRLRLAPEWLHDVSWTERRFAVGLKRADLRRATRNARVPSSQL